MTCKDRQTNAFFVVFKENLNAVTTNSLIIISSLVEQLLTWKKTHLVNGPGWPVSDTLMAIIGIINVGLRSSLKDTFLQQRTAQTKGNCFWFLKKVFFRTHFWAQRH